MYRTVIIDDEQNCVEVLEILLKQNFNDIDVIGTFTSSKQALTFLQQNTVDLVFLDIQMPFLTGIDLLEKLDKYHFHVVFTTAFDQYAIKAIKLSALDYLLKPIDEDLLENTISKFRKVKGQTDIKNQITSLLNHYGAVGNSTGTSSNFNNKIAISFQDRIVFYDSQEIMFCQSNDNYTTIQLKGGEKVMASKTMKHFEDLLAPLGFIRPHQSYIINSKFIAQYSKKDGGFLILTDGSAIPISRHRKEEILLLFKGEF
ncbi:MAG: response regulator transcription factor [Bacteroidetes bacterium]|nr:response regulator transcription factor [Bacteroidota bacterium]